MRGTVLRADGVRLPDEDRLHGDGRHPDGGGHRAAHLRHPAHVLRQPVQAAAAVLRVLRRLPVQRVPDLRHAADDRRRAQVLDLAGGVHFRGPQHLPGRGEHLHLHSQHHRRDARLRSGATRVSRSQWRPWNPRPTYLPLFQHICHVRIHRFLLRAAI